MNPKEYKQALEDYQAMKAAERKEIEDLQHWGIKGMKWGVRKYQNKDGSLTDEGRRHYGVGDPRDAELASKIKMKEEKQKAKLMIQRNKAEAKLQMKMDRAAAKNDAIRIKAEQYGQERAAEEETKQKRLTISAVKKEERDRHNEASNKKKLVLTAAAVIGTIAVIKAIKDKNISSPEIVKKAAKGKEILKDSSKGAGAILKNSARDVTKDTGLAKSAGTAAKDVLYKVNFPDRPTDIGIIPQLRRALFHEDDLEEADHVIT